MPTPLGVDKHVVMVFFTSKQVNIKEYTMAIIFNSSSRIFNALSLNV